MSKFIVPLSLADFIESPANVFPQGFVGVYMKNSEMKLMKDGAERDLVLGRLMEGLRSDLPVAPVFVTDTVLEAISKLQNSLSSLTLTGDVQGTVEYKNGKLEVETTIVGEFVDKKWTHVQSEPSMEWIMNHPLQKEPAVTFLNSAKEEIEGDKSYPDTNTVIARFTSPVMGYAVMS